MARQVLPIVGALVGGYFGGPTGAQLGWAAGAAIGGAVDPVINKGPSLGELPAQTSAEGAPRGIVFGTADLYGNVLCTGPAIKTTEIITGEKGAPKTEAEVVYRNYAIRICEGPIGGVPRVWQDEKLVYDVRPGSLMLAESAKWISNKVIYLGTEDQLPDIYLQLNVSGVGETPAYRGTAYMVVGLEDLTDRLGSIPQYRFEVASSTEVTEILGPLVVNDWEGARPLHSDGGDMTFTFTGDPTVYTDFATAAAAAAAASVASGIPSASEATTFIAYTTSTDAIANVFPGGATLASDPQTVTYRLAARQPDSWIPEYVEPIFLCSTLYANEVPTDDGLLYGMPLVSDNRLELTKLYSYPGPTSGTYSYFHNNCTNYPASGGNFPQAIGTPVLRLVATRVPSPPEGWTKVIGTAKVLVDVIYTSGALTQQALGPVLLPGDPDYDNATFWSDARDAAVLAGTMDASIVTYPVIVSAYATGTSTLAGEPVVLGDIVADLHARANVEFGNYNVDELNDLVAGLVLAGDYTAADAINTLCGPYFFARSEYDGKLWYPKLGKPVVETLTIDDLVEVPDLSRREQAIEYPKKLHLFYKHAASGYAVVKATSSRSSSDARVIGETSIQVPVVLNADQAAQTAHKMHKVAWADADGEVKLTIPFCFIRLVVANNVGLVLRGQVRRLRIDEIDDDLLGGVRNLTLRHDRQSAYTSNVTGIPIPEPTLPPSTIVGDTAFAFLDIPSRLDTEDDLNYYVAGTGAMAGWYGWALQRSLDAGANYSTVDQFTRTALMGVLLDAVPAASEHYTDTTNAVRVQLYRDDQSIEDITDVQFLAEGGAFALEKADGSWEVMQYRDVATDSGGIPTLSMLHRGRLNSGASAHIAGALFVMLDRVEHIPAQSAWLGQNLTHRAVSLNQSPELADDQTDTYLGRSQLEWSVAYLTLTRDGADVITATWTPRHRFGTDDAPIASINFTGYRVTLYDGASTVTFDQAAAGFTYDASALADPLTVSVSALNRITGAGPITSGSV